eukprot:8872231-Prorocentrum_lima.AAC.1
MYVGDVMRHNSIGRLWSQPAFGEVVAVNSPGPKKTKRASAPLPVLPVMDLQGHTCSGEGP